MSLLECLAEAGVDLTSPINSQSDYLLRLLQLQAVTFLIGFGLKYTFKIIIALTRGDFF